MNSEAVKAWIASRRAAERREQQERQSHPLSPETAIASALALIALDGRLHGWPRDQDPVGQREDDFARRCWERLRDAQRRR